MPTRRVVALAQALTMILLLAPGLPAGVPGAAEAAIRPADAGTVTIFDASGLGVGCEGGRRRFKGPRKPNDPPWPPGTRPVATPEPTSDTTADEPAASDGQAEPDGQSADGASADEPVEGPTADGPTQLLAGSDIRVAQADPTPEPTDDPVSDASQPAPAAEPAVEAQPGPASGDEGDVDLEPDVETAPETTRQGRRSRLIKGIDVSHHNGDIDYEKVRKDGNRFVFIKATQDNAFIDPMFPTNLAKARAAGLAAGAYHFFDYTLDGTVQADHFLDRIEAFGGVDGALPPVVDVECWAPIGGSTHVATEARLRDFVRRIYERTGRLPIVYTSVFMWDQVTGNAEGFEDLPLWAACWGCDLPPSLAPGWDDWAFWQTGVSRVRGVGRLDGNFFRGSSSDLEALQLRPFAIEGGADATRRQRVELDLGGRDATHFRTSPDGQAWSGWTRIRSAPEVQLQPVEGTQSIFVQLRVSPEMVSPILEDSITLDRTGPELSEPAVALRPGQVGEGSAGLPVSVSWTAIDAHAGLSDATVAIACGVGRAERIEAPGSAAPGELATWDATATVVPGARCSISAVGRDGVGNTSRRTLRDVQASVVSPSGDEVPSAIVSGMQVGVIARRGPDAGRATITLDGTVLGTLDLYSATAGGPEVVFVADLEPGVDQEVRVEATGTAATASSGTEVTVDAFVTLDVMSTTAVPETPGRSEAPELAADSPAAETDAPAASDAAPAQTDAP